MYVFRVVLIVIVVFCCKVGYSQKEAIVVENVWNNELNSYNPRPFFDKLFVMFSETLNIKKVVEEKGSLLTEKTNESIDKKIKDKMTVKGSPNTYYISLESQLGFPAINVSKIIFKNPSRTSRLFFSYHVYDEAGKEVIADTIVNRGCISKVVDKDGGKKNFYDSYQNFLDDMDCYADEIKKRLKETPRFKK